MQQSVALHVPLEPQLFEKVDIGSRQQLVENVEVSLLVSSVSHTGLGRGRVNWEFLCILLNFYLFFLN